MDSKLQPSQAACWNYLGKEKASPLSSCATFTKFVIWVVKIPVRMYKINHLLFSERKNAQRKLKNNFFFQKQQVKFKFSLNFAALQSNVKIKRFFLGLLRIFELWEKTSKIDSVVILKKLA